MKVLAGLVLSRGSEGKSTPCLSPHFGWLPTVVGDRWLLDASL